MPQKHSEATNLYALFIKVRKKLSETSAGFWSDLEIFSSLNSAQLHIARKSKCLRKEVTVTTEASTREYDLRNEGFSDIIDIAEDGVNFYQNGTAYNFLEYVTKKQLNLEFPGWRGVAASVPKRYYYNKAAKTIGLDPLPNSSNAGAYLLISGYHKPKVLNAGTAEAGSSTTITLATGSSSVPYPKPTDDYYNDLYIEIYGGTGAGQKAKITDYDGATRVCTAAFTTAPDSTSIYGMIPEIQEEGHLLMYLYAIADMWEKGGSRTTLSQSYWRRYFEELGEFIGENLEEDDRILVKETYR